MQSMYHKENDLLIITPCIILYHIVKNRKMGYFRTQLMIAVLSAINIVTTLPDVAAFVPSSFILERKRNIVPKVAFSAVKLDTVTAEEDKTEIDITRQMALYLTICISILSFQSLTATHVEAATENNYNTNSVVLSKNSLQEYSGLGYTGMIISNDVELLEGSTTTSQGLSIDKNDEKKPVNIAQEGGKGFFIIYVVFSFLAGGVEMTKRFQKWLENRGGNDFSS